MAKKFTVSNEQLKPDAVYGSKLVSKFINCLMNDGKKSGRKMYMLLRWTNISPARDVNSFVVGW